MGSPIKHGWRFKNEVSIHKGNPCEPNAALNTQVFYSRLWMMSLRADSSRTVQTFCLQGGNQSQESWLKGSWSFSLVWRASWEVWQLHYVSSPQMLFIVKRRNHSILYRQCFGNAQSEKHGWPRFTVNTLGLHFNLEEQKSTHPFWIRHAAITWTFSIRRQSLGAPSGA